jgi:Alkylmercury lyase
MTPECAGRGEVGIALEAAAIPPARRGKERASRLSRGERLLYELILQTFAAGDTPARDALAVAASGFDVNVEQALETLGREDLVHRDSPTGSILVAYPFSATPRGHRVLIDGERWVEAMCAIDALGIAPMLNLPIEIVSRDPVNGGEIWVRIDPGDGAWWEPEDAVVLAGSAGCAGPSFRSCCDVLNFFESGENALGYLLAHPDISGHSISLPEAIELGRIIFGDVLKEP